MTPALHSRLQTAIRKVALFQRLKKVALVTEDAFVERLGERSQKLLLNIRGKLFKVMKQIQPHLKEQGQQALLNLLEQIRSVISDEGVVSAQALDSSMSDLEQKWKEVSQATGGNPSVMHIFNALEKVYRVAALGVILQNKRMIERAKTDEKVKNRFYEVTEQLAKLAPQIPLQLQKALEKIPEQKAEEQVAPKQQQEATTEETVKKQLGVLEAEMRGVTDQLSQVIVKRANELLGEGSELVEALEDNLFTLYNKRQVNPLLNRDKNFYEDALHLEHGSSKIDLGEFLDTRQKKTLYLCYRSLVMALRALGVVQFAKDNPDNIVKNPKLIDLVSKARQILVKRKDTIVGQLRKLNKEEVKEEEKGIPKGTFSDFFES